ncbi:7965_t:CDS:2, partial [Diversispora eburnea]
THLEGPDAEHSEASIPTWKDNFGIKNGKQNDNKSEDISMRHNLC